MRALQPLSVYHGQDYSFDGPNVLCVRLFSRWDLMTRQQDQGRLPLCAAEFICRYGRTETARIDGRLDWFVRFFWRSDVGEIASRLAGGDE